MSNYTDNFKESDADTLYDIDITSENGEAISFSDVNDAMIQRVIDLVEGKTDAAV